MPLYPDDEALDTESRQLSYSLAKHCTHLVTAQPFLLCTASYSFRNTPRIIWCFDLNFWWIFHTDFHSGCINLHPHPHCISIPLSLHFLTASAFLMAAILTWMRQNLIAILSCIFLMTKNIDQKKTQTQQVVFIHIYIYTCIHTHTCAYNNNNERKGAINENGAHGSGSRKSNWKGSEEGKGKVI